MTLPSEKLAELGLELPEVAKPVAAYVPAIEDRGVVRTSGQLPLENGELACIGAVGEDGADPEDAYEAARICALNAMAAAAVVDMGTRLRPRPHPSHTEVAVVAATDTLPRKLRRLRHLLTVVAAAVITVREPRTSFRKIPPFVRMSLLFTPCLRLFATHCSLLRWTTCRLGRR